MTFSTRTTWPLPRSRCRMVSWRAAGCMSPRWWRETPAGEIIADDVVGATLQCLQNMEAVLRTRGLDRRSVVKVTVYLVDLASYGAMNRAFEEFFGGTYPARTTIQAGALGLGTVELDAVAYAGRLTRPNARSAARAGPGGVLAAKPAWAFSDDSQILCEEGRIVAIGDATEGRASVHSREQGVTVRVLDGDGLVALPGLIDGHVHPVAGSTSVVPAGTDWTHCYLNAGVTACVSAGELTVPGFRARRATPDDVTTLATTSAWCFGNIAAPPRVFAGTLLAVPGLQERHIAEVADAGGRCLKYIYYPFGENGWREEVERYRGPGARTRARDEATCGWDVISGRQRRRYGEDRDRGGTGFDAHANGGPIPLSDTETMSVIEETNAFIEVIPGRELAATRKDRRRFARERRTRSPDRWHRLPGRQRDRTPRAAPGDRRDLRVGKSGSSDRPAMRDRQRRPDPRTGFPAARSGLASPRTSCSAAPSEVPRTGRSALQSSRES